MANVNHRPIGEIEAQWLKFERPADGARFRHYKGGLYEVIGTGFLEATEEPAVIYQSLEKDIVWVRTAANFFEDVNAGGKTVKRFEIIKGGK